MYCLIQTGISMPRCSNFVEPWKIDILDYLNENYMCDLSLEEIASYTGRSLATFKRDFAKVSNLTPQKWIIKRRLEAAHGLIKIRQEESDGSLLRCGFQEPVAFLQDIQGGLWCRSFMVR